MEKDSIQVITKTTVYLRLCQVLLEQQGEKGEIMVHLVDQVTFSLGSEGGAGKQAKCLRHKKVCTKTPCEGKVKRRF